MTTRTTAWRNQLRMAMEDAHDESPIVAVAPDERVLDVEFDASFGGSEGPDVLVWTQDRVYFPVVYDGAEWMGSAPRNPTATGQHHVGGE